MKKNITRKLRNEIPVFGKNEKLDSFKLESPKLKSFRLNWKVPSEVRKFLLKLESFTAFGKFWLKLESRQVTCAR